MSVRGEPLDDLNLTPFEVGYVLGLLVGEGSFGGDRFAAAVRVNMHVRHHQLLSWLEERFPGTHVYGPYLHDGRHHIQWVATGPALYDFIVPLVGRHLDSIDDHVAQRFIRMCTRYGLWWNIEPPTGTLLLREAPAQYGSV